MMHIVTPLKQLKHKNIKEPSRWNSLSPPSSSPWSSPLPILSVSSVRNSQERQPWLLQNYPWGGHWGSILNPTDVHVHVNLMSTNFFCWKLHVSKGRGARTRARNANAKNYLVSDMADSTPRSRMQEWLITFKYLLLSIHIRHFVKLTPLWELSFLCWPTWILKTSESFGFKYLKLRNVNFKLLRSQPTGIT